METEKLWREEEQRRIAAEQKLFDTVYKQQNNGAGPASASGEQGLFELANEELLRKGRIDRELSKKVDLYEGKNIETLNQTELQTI